MSKWLVRGLAFAAGMVLVRLFQGALINAFQTQAGLISVVLVLIFITVAVIWGTIDGRADAREQPDPDRRKDLAMTWLLTGLVAGFVSGLVVWLISLFYTGGLYTGGLINEVSTFAAFTALVVFLPAMAGVVLGRWLIDRKEAYAPRRSGGDDDRADTDVFDAVHEDDTPTGEVPVGGRDHEHTRDAGGERTEERTGGVTTASREERTDPVRTDDRTETAATAREGTDAEQTRPNRTDDRR